MDILPSDIQPLTAVPFLVVLALSVAAIALSIVGSGIVVLVNWLCQRAGADQTVPAILDVTAFLLVVPPIAFMVGESFPAAAICLPAVGAFVWLSRTIDWFAQRPILTRCVIAAAGVSLMVLLCADILMGLPELLLYSLAAPSLLILILSFTGGMVHLERSLWSFRRRKAAADPLQ